MMFIWCCQQAKQRKIKASGLNHPHKDWIYHQYWLSESTCDKFVHNLPWFRVDQESHYWNSTLERRLHSHKRSSPITTMYHITSPKLPSN